MAEKNYNVLVAENERLTRELRRLKIQYDKLQADYKELQNKQKRQVKAT